MPFDKMTLPNGLTIVVESVAGSPDAAILLGTRKGGSIYNPGGFHFLEHLLTKRGGARTAREFSEGIDKLGIDFQAHTSNVAMTITGRFKPDLLSQALKIFSKISGQSFFSERDFKIEKGVILVERKVGKDNAEEFLDELLYRFLFGKHPIARPIEGIESEITTFRFTELLDMFKNFFSPANLILVVVGPYEIAEVFNQVGENFSGLKKRRFSCPKIKRIKLKTAIPATHVRKKIINAAYVSWAFPAPSFFSKDFIPMVILTDLLGEKLYNELRNKRGLSYDVRQVYFDSPVVNFVILSANCEAKNLGAVSAIVEKEFRRLRRVGVSEGDFYKTLNAMIKKTELIAVNPSERAEYLYKSIILGSSLESLDDAVTRMRERVFVDMRPLARKFLRPSLVKQVILTPPTKKQLVQPISDKI